MTGNKTTTPPYCWYNLTPSVAFKNASLTPLLVLDLRFRKAEALPPASSTASANSKGGDREAEIGVGGPGGPHAG